MSGSNEQRAAAEDLLAKYGRDLKFALSWLSPGDECPARPSVDELHALGCRIVFPRFWAVSFSFRLSLYGL